MLIFSTVLAFTVGNVYKWSSRERICLIVFGAYLTFVFLSTIITRKPYEGVHYRLVPFWTFKQVKRFGWNHVLREVFFNLGMLFPLSIILKIGFPKIKTRWIVLTGFGLSLLIEYLQLWLMRGVFEVDDLLFNTIGVYLGGTIGSIVISKFNYKQ